MKPLRVVVPFIWGIVGGLVVAFPLMWFAHSSGIFAGYAGFLVGFNVYAFVFAGASRPQPPEGWKPGMPFEPGRDVELG